MFHQLLPPVGNSLALSSLVAALPVLVVVLLLGVFRRPAWQAALAGLIVALAIAVGNHSGGEQHPLTRASRRFERRPQAMKSARAKRPSAAVAPPTVGIRARRAAAILTLTVNPAWAATASARALSALVSAAARR